MKLLAGFAVTVILFGALVLGAGIGPRMPWSPASFAPVTYVADHGQPTIVCLGNSLTAGNGAIVSESYPAWLQRKLSSHEYDWRVVNAGISGNRVADGLHRLSHDVLIFHPKVVIVELGSNDPGHTPALEWESNLGTIVSRLQTHQISVILGGLDEPGMGNLYRHIAAVYHVPLVWFVQNVARYPALWAPDGNHPNGPGYRLVVEAFWPALRPLLRA